MSRAPSRGPLATHPEAGPGPGRFPNPFPAVAVQRPAHSRGLGGVCCSAFPVTPASGSPLPRPHPGPSWLEMTIFSQRTGRCWGRSQSVHSALIEHLLCAGPSTRCGELEEPGHSRPRSAASSLKPLRGTAWDEPGRGRGHQSRRRDAHCDGPVTKPQPDRPSPSGQAVGQRGGCRTGQRAASQADHALPT